MKGNNIVRYSLLILLVPIVLIGSLLSTTSASMADKDFDEVIMFLSQELKLKDDQTQQLTAAFEKFANTLDQLLEAQEAEDADPDALIKGVKQAQDAHNKELQKILTADQFKQYNALREKAIKEMLSDLAEIKLMDIQPKTTISNEQVSQLAPIMGDSMYKIIKIAWENYGKRLRPPQKIRLAKQLKRIQRDTRAGIEKILTPEQLQAWDKYKEEQKKK
jgi:hypothetical protein